MPKMKTNSAASKRAKITGTGKVKHVGSAMRHNLEHKSARKRRELSADDVLRGGQAKKLHQLLQKLSLIHISEPTRPVVVSSGLGW